MPEVQIAAYYFPNYHVDPRNEKAHGAGWTEWELVRLAQPRFPGHAQPRVPAWGYEDEADPAVMERKIAAAADHGLSAFLFDWYHYEDGPFLGRCLDEGFLRANNRQRLQFALMWANHDWIDIHPAKAGQRGPLQFPGRVNRAGFSRICDVVLERYFSQENYWKIQGCPYFSIYELAIFIDGLGGLEAAADALAEFRAKTKAAGFPDLHLGAVLWNLPVLPSEKAVADPQAALTRLGFSSVTSYVWVHHVPLTQFPQTPYALVAQQAAAHWDKAVAQFDLPYYPNVTMGWDSSPRTVLSDRFEKRGYPFMASLSGNTPAAFGAALRQAVDLVAQRPPQQRIITINAWNEWTEGSYLEPDTEHGMGYLEAIATAVR